MPQDRNPASSADGGQTNPQPKENSGAPAPFESDTQRIMHRHLQNKNDVITDEDIASIRVGMTPAAIDTASEELLENEEADAARDDEGDSNEDEERITPWDSIDPDK